MRWVNRQDGRLRGVAHPWQFWSNVSNHATPKPGTLSALLDDLARTPPSATGSGWATALVPGHAIGRFTLVRELTREPFSVTFEARDALLERRVALKVLRAVSSVAGPAQRARHEAETIADLAHPNLAALFDAGRCPEGPYLVYELLEGARLSERLEASPTAPAEAVRIALSVARALSVAHARGVAHHDLTPDQVFLCNDGAVKVLDLGVAHTFGRTRLDSGQPGYVAPEQWRGAPEDERTDVYALGVLLYRLLTGQLPFPDDDSGRAAASARAAPSVDIPEWPGLGELVARMLAKDPVDRPRDGAALVDGLELVLASAATSTSASSTSVRIRRQRLARRPVALATGLALLALLAGGAWLLLGRSPLREATPSVAVLPFADLSEKQDQEYFADGLGEEIINALAQLNGLRVTGRRSVYPTRDRMGDLRALGRELGVANLLVGSVQRSANRIRVTARLVRSEDGRSLWSKAFERELTGVFAVQDEIANAVVAALEVELLSGQRPTSKEYRTADPETYLQFLQGRRYSRRDSMESSRKAAAAFQRAIDLEPSYAPAWAGLSHALYNGWGNSGDNLAELEANRRRAEQAAERAVELAPELAAGYAARSFFRVTLRFDWTGGRADMERALRLNPGDPEMMWRHARQVLGPLGRFDEAVTLARRASQIDPHYFSPWSTLAALYLAQERLELARSAALRSIELGYEEADSAPVVLASAELLDRKPEAAILAANRSPEPAFQRQFLAVASHDLKRPQEARAALEEMLAKNADDAPFQIACVYAWFGQADKAFEWLDRAFEKHDGGVADLRMEPLLRSLRNDPRYKAIEKRLNLPPN
jgi:TolB-like protein/tetratricopeptide (TPR) repeat protein